MPKNKFFIYLASQSPRRKEILSKMKIPFRVVKSDYVEKKIPDAGPEQTVMWHACQKARRAKVPAGARFVLGADTVVVYEEHILGKPKNLKEAAKMLSMLSGKEHFVLTGISIVDHEMHSIETGYSRTKVKFKKLTPKAIQDYMKKVHVLDKAGSYAIQEGPKIVSKIEGSHSNVVGLPMELLRTMLKEL